MTDRLFALGGRTILLTGATDDLGREMARALSDSGARVLVNSRSRARAEALAETLSSAGGNAAPAVFDVTNARQVEAFFASLGDQPLHGIVANAHAGTRGTIETATSQAFSEAFEVAVIAVQKLIRTALPQLRRAVSATGSASVVGISAMYGMPASDAAPHSAGQQAAPPPACGVARAGLLQFTRYAACEFGREGIRFNAICLGPFPSQRIQAMAPELVAGLGERVPLGRAGRASEIAGPALFLLSGAASYVNGATLAVDGGWSCL